MTNKQSEFENMLSESSESSTSSKQKKRKTLRNWLIVLGSIIVVVGIAAGIGYAMINSSFNEIERVEVFDPELERPAVFEVPEGEKAPINILLLGSDSRETSESSGSAEAQGGFRSDTIMVVQVSADREDVTVMSIMRDNWVPIQGYGEAKINAAAAFGGVPLAVNTVENFIDARIDHIAIVDFESFKGLTDAVGGVTVNNPIAFTSSHGNFPFAEGTITLSGEEALSFVRERFSFTDGDYQRARNQQAYLTGLLSQILSKENLTNPSKITATFEGLKPYLIVDQELDLGTAVGLGLELKDVRSDDITFFTSPTLGTGTSGDGQSIVLPDWEELEKLRDDLRAGKLNEYAAAQDN